MGRDVAALENESRFVLIQMEEYGEDLSNGKDKISDLRRIQLSGLLQRRNSFQEYGFRGAIETVLAAK